VWLLSPTSNSLAKRNIENAERAILSAFLSFQEFFMKREVLLLTGPGGDAQGWGNMAVTEVLNDTINSLGVKCSIAYVNNRQEFDDVMDNASCDLVWSSLYYLSEREDIVGAPDDAEWIDYAENKLQTPDDFIFDGIQRHIFDEQHTLNIIEHFKNGIIVFDDCRCYFKDNIDTRVVDLLIRRRQRAVDVFVVGHGFTTVPPKFFTYYSDAVLFRTVDNIDRRKNCITNFEYFKNAQAKVNKQSLKEPHYHIRIKNTDI
jgi:hypothetical protein